MMNKNVKIAKELMRLAKSLMADSENDDFERQLDELEVGMGYVD